jgi:hypothetical protein
MCGRYSIRLSPEYIRSVFRTVGGGLRATDPLGVASIPPKPEDIDGRPAPGLTSSDRAAVPHHDINDRTISIFQINHDETQPIDDVRAQYRYVGAAPQS